MVFFLRGFLGRLFFLLWLIGVSVSLHQFGKLADMIKVIADFRMILVNEAAGAFHLFSPFIVNHDFAAVWDTELFLVMRVDKTDSLLGSVDVLIKPFPNITITVKVIIAPCGITAEQISIFVRVHTEAKLGTVVPFESTLWGTLRKGAHIITVMQKPLIFTQGIYHIVKLRLKFFRFPLRPVVKPCGVKAIS